MRFAPIFSVLPFFEHFGILGQLRCTYLPNVLGVDFEQPQRRNSLASLLCPAISNKVYLSMAMTYTILAKVASVRGSRSETAFPCRKIWLRYLHLSLRKDRTEVMLLLAASLYFLPRLILSSMGALSLARGSTLAIWLTAALFHQYVDRESSVEGSGCSASNGELQSDRWFLPRLKHTNG